MKGCTLNYNVGINCIWEEHLMKTFSEMLVRVYACHSAWNSLINHVNQSLFVRRHQQKQHFAQEASTASNFILVVVN